MKRTNQNRKAFCERIEKNQGIIHKITLIYAGNYADREDLFQEICLQLWKSYNSFREEARFSTWMYRVALNTAISTVRKRKNIFTFEPLKDYGIAEPESANETRNVQILYQAISQLNQIDKAIILLWLEEKNYDEIASITGISKKNVSVRLVRVKRKLEELINEIRKQES
jgi:RNA polymerase sigma-70 factor (ECF subfamily)